MKTFFCTESWKHLIVVMCILVLISVITFAITLALECLYSLCFIIIFPIILLIFRKFFFAKIKLTKEGISKIYKRETLHYIKWENLQSVVVMPKKSLFFLDKQISKNEFTTRYTSLISFSITKEKLEAFIQYRKYVKCEIKNIDLLGMDYKCMLQKKDVS